LLSLKNTEGKYKRVGKCRYAVHLWADHLSRPQAEQKNPSVWCDILPERDHVLDMPTFLQSYFYVGEIVVIGDQGVLLDEVYDVLKGLTLIAYVDVNFFSDNVWLKNSMLAVQSGASMAGATVDIGLGGLLAAVVGEAKIKGNHWAAAYCYAEIPEGFEVAKAPLKLQAARKKNETVAPTNGNGKPVQQEGPPPEILTQRR